MTTSNSHISISSSDVSSDFQIEYIHLHLKGNFLKMFIYLFILAVLDFCCSLDLSLFAVSRGYSLVVVHKLLIAVSSLVAEHGL